jgi:transposase-like protein
MTMTVGKFREQAKQLRGRGRRGGRPYPDALRRWAVSYARSTGLGVNKVADRLGICGVTLRTWMQEPKRDGGVLRPVVVTPDAHDEPQQARPRSQPRLILRTAQGHELGPLDVDTAIAVLRELS